MHLPATVALLLLILASQLHPTRATSSSAQTYPRWCGKHYQTTSPPLSPGGKFAYPPTSSNSSLRISCTPRLKPYISTEDVEGSVVVDTYVGSGVGGGGGGFDGKVGDGFEVLVEVLLDDADGDNDNGVRRVELGSGRGKVGQVGLEVGIHLEGRLPEPEVREDGAGGGGGFNVSCSVKLEGGEVFNVTNTLYYLPPNPNAGGSTVKVDRLTKSLLVRPESDTDGAGSVSVGGRESIFPFGFYTDFGDRLVKDFPGALEDMKTNGYNLVHPVPTFDNLTALEMVLDKMEELGLWLMYDMRWTYKNSTAVTEQVDMIKNRKNLLLWYTADEPDGQEDALDAPSTAAELINQLDGYHPISLVLNCEDYYFDEYTRGSDIIMEDVYPVDVNVTFSKTYNTSCTNEFGCCGCDNCHHFARPHTLLNVPNRVELFNRRLRILGRDRETLVWGVPQAFGGSEFWTGYPTDWEFMAMSLARILHGSRGIIPWDIGSQFDNSTAPITNSSRLLASTLPLIASFVFDPSSSDSFTPLSPESFDDFGADGEGDLHAGIWSRSKEAAAGADAGTMLLVVTNLNSDDGYVVDKSFEIPGTDAGAVTNLTVTEVINYGSEWSLVSDRSDARRFGGREMDVVFGVSPGERVDVKVRGAGSLVLLLR